MRRKLIRASIMLAASVVGTGCDRGNAVDQRRLRDLATKYEAHYEFSLKWDHHLIVKAKPGHKPTDIEIEDIFSIFALDPSRKSLRDTNYIFLNLYDSDGTFMYKLFFDRAAGGRLQKSPREETS